MSSHKELQSRRSDKITDKYTIIKGKWSEFTTTKHYDKEDYTAQ
jgi:hypothetical protein